MEDVSLYIVEQPLPGYPEAEAPEPPHAGAQAAEEPSGAGSEELIKSDQVNGVLVLSLLDKIIGAVDQIQLTQAQLEERQAEMEGAVQSIQGELSKLGKAHATTSNTVSKLLEKVRKVSVNVKTVRGSLERQAGQIKKLEVNEAELLRRRNFKVMIYQRPRPGIWVGDLPVARLSSQPGPGAREIHPSSGERRWAADSRGA
ncbi:Caveolae-associated protein 1 [Saguinus oedipus]|uniref:Caveolae-associated protein 1 n=1 Tax=Saguinus oedipus TaxID=9490 RepID=A0ABQ9VSU1_SAGOE|nr:Caveolae-associated protein 1 [Saguinus oedipus]